VQVEISLGTFLTQELENDIYYFTLDNNLSGVSDLCRFGLSPFGSLEVFYLPG